MRTLVILAALIVGLVTPQSVAATHVPRGAPIDGRDPHRRDLPVSNRDG
jgi:hypothetical protein